MSINHSPRRIAAHTLALGDALRLAEIMHPHSAPPSSIDSRRVREDRKDRRLRERQSRKCR